MMLVVRISIQQGTLFVLEPTGYMLKPIYGFVLPLPVVCACFCVVCTLAAAGLNDYADLKYR